jgi:hypothetical protein
VRKAKEKMEEEKKTEEKRRKKAGKEKGMERPRLEVSGSGKANGKETPKAMDTDGDEDEGSAHKKQKWDPVSQLSLALIVLTPL